MKIKPRWTTWLAIILIAAGLASGKEWPGTWVLFAIAVALLFGDYIGSKPYEK